MKAILMTVLALALVGGLIGGGLFAYFSDTEVSTGNTFVAGTLTLDSDFWNMPEDEDFKPCEWKLWESDTLTSVSSPGMDGLLDVTVNVTGWVGGEDGAPDIMDTAEIILFAGLTNAERDRVLAALQGPPPAANVLAAYDRIQLLLDDSMVPGGIGMKIYFWGLLATADGNTYPEGGPTERWEMASGDSLRIDIIAHLKSKDDPANDDVMQGDSAVVDKIYELDQEPCDWAPGGGDKPVQSVPETPVFALYQHPGTHSYWDVTLSGVPAGYDVTNASYVGWCVDQDHYCLSGEDYQVVMISSLDSTIYSVKEGWWGVDAQAAPATFNYINYLINTYPENDGGQGDTARTVLGPYSLWQNASPLQWAIWFFLDGVSEPDMALRPQAAALVDDALANGATFWPDTGEDAMVLLFIYNAVYDPWDNEYPAGDLIQVVGIEVDP